jgi:hypothetical protein
VMAERGSGIVLLENNSLKWCLDLGKGILDATWITWINRLFLRTIRNSLIAVETDLFGFTKKREHTPEAGHFARPLFWYLSQWAVEKVSASYSHFINNNREVRSGGSGYNFVDEHLYRFLARFTHLARELGRASPHMAMRFDGF